MNIIVKRTARAESVVSIEQPNSQDASVSAIRVKSMSVSCKGPKLKDKIAKNGRRHGTLVPQWECHDAESECGVCGAVLESA
jgi:hypothetical protein